MYDRLRYARNLPLPSLLRAHRRHVEQERPRRQRVLGLLLQAEVVPEGVVEAAPESGHAVHEVRPHHPAVASHAEAHLRPVKRERQVSPRR